MYSHRHEYSKTIHKDYSHSYDNFGRNLVYPSNGSRKPIRELPSGGLYFSRGLTFFINYFQQKQHEIRSRPKLSVVYDPKVSPDTYIPEEAIHFRLPDTPKTEYVAERKCLRITVENDGGGVAEKCKATLRLLNHNPSNTRHPS
jgi:hypothetical protein